MQQYCGCYGLLLRYMPKNVLFVTYSRSISQPHTRLTITERSRDSGQSISIHSLIRGWPSGCPTLYNSVLLFNSQPHTRLTGYRLGVDCRIAFQFTASYEADLSLTPSMALVVIFQFTASYEADPNSGHLRLFNLAFQFTASYEADLASDTVFHWSSVFQFTASYEADQ